MFRRRQAGLRTEVEVKHAGQHTFAAPQGATCIQSNPCAKARGKRPCGGVLEHLVAKAAMQAGVDHRGILPGPLVGQHRAPCQPRLAVVGSLFWNKKRTFVILPDAQSPDPIPLVSLFRGGACASRPSRHLVRAGGRI